MTRVKVERVFQFSVDFIKFSTSVFQERSIALTYKCFSCADAGKA